MSRQKDILNKKIKEVELKIRKECAEQSIYCRGYLGEKLNKISSRDYSVLSDTVLISFFLKAQSNKLDRLCETLGHLYAEINKIIE